MKTTNRFKTLMLTLIASLALSFAMAVAVMASPTIDYAKETITGIDANSKWGTSAATATPSGTAISGSELSFSTISYDGKAKTIYIATGTTGTTVAIKARPATPAVTFASATNKFSTIASANIDKIELLIKVNETTSSGWLNINGSADTSFNGKTIKNYVKVVNSTLENASTTVGYTISFRVKATSDAPASLAKEVIVKAASATTATDMLAINYVKETIQCAKDTPLEAKMYQVGGTVPTAWTVVPAKSAATGTSFSNKLTFEAGKTLIIEFRVKAGTDTPPGEVLKIELSRPGKATYSLIEDSVTATVSALKEGLTKTTTATYLSLMEFKRTSGSSTTVSLEEAFQAKDTVTAGKFDQTKYLFSKTEVKATTVITNFLPLSLKALFGLPVATAEGKIFVTEPGNQDSKVLASIPSELVIPKKLATPTASTVKISATSITGLTLDTPYLMTITTAKPAKAPTDWKATITNEIIAKNHGGSIKINDKTKFPKGAIVELRAIELPAKDAAFKSWDSAPFKLTLTMAAAPAVTLDYVTATFKGLKPGIAFQELASSSAVIDYDADKWIILSNETSVAAFAPVKLGTPVEGTADNNSLLAYGKTFAFRVMKTLDAKTKTLVDAVPSEIKLVSIPEKKDRPGYAAPISDKAVTFDAGKGVIINVTNKYEYSFNGVYWLNCGTTIPNFNALRAYSGATDFYIRAKGTAGTATVAGKLPSLAKKITVSEIE